MFLLNLQKCFSAPKSINPLTEPSLVRGGAANRGNHPGHCALGGSADSAEGATTLHGHQMPPTLLSGFSLPLLPPHRPHTPLGSALMPFWHCKDILIIWYNYCRRFLISLQPSGLPLLNAVTPAPFSWEIHPSGSGVDTDQLFMNKVTWGVCSPALIALLSAEGTQIATVAV